MLKSTPPRSPIILVYSSLNRFGATQLWMMFGEQGTKVVFALLVAGGRLTNEAKMPVWIIFLCYTMIAAGTLVGGFRIVRTMGMKLTKLDPMHGFCAETGGGVTILGVSLLGIPVSTTHTITGAIIGVGMTGGLKAVRWLMAEKIIWAWIFTVPVSGLVGAFSYYGYHYLSRYF